MIGACGRAAPHAMRYRMRRFRLSALAAMVIIAAAVSRASAATSTSAKGGETASATDSTGAAGDTKGAANSATDSGNPASAFQLSTSKGPTNIKSDSLDLDYKNKIVTFRGHVFATQNDEQLTTDNLKVLYGQDFHDIKQAFADGNVRMSQADKWVTGDHAVLDETAHTVVVTGNPVVHQGDDEVAGAKIIVHLDTGKSEVQSAKGVPVTATFFPKTNQPQTKSTPAASAASSTPAAASAVGTN